MQAINVKDIFQQTLGTIPIQLLKAIKPIVIARLTEVKPVL